LQIAVALGNKHQSSKKFQIGRMLFGRGERKVWKIKTHPPNQPDWHLKVPRPPLEIRGQRQGRSGSLALATQIPPRKPKIIKKSSLGDAWVLVGDARVEAGLLPHFWLWRYCWPHSHITNNLAQRWHPWRFVGGGRPARAHGSGGIMRPAPNLPANSPLCG